MPKIKMMMKKFGRVIFELSISKLGKLGYMEIFMKNYPLFKRFLTNQGKNKNEDEKYGKMSPIFGFSMKMKTKKFGKMSSVFEFSISKLNYIEIFMKI